MTEPYNLATSRNTFAPMYSAMEKIPKTAKRVFKGTIFDVYQWKQKTFDGSYELYEAVKRLDTVIIIPTLGSRVVVVKERQPRVPESLGFISGRIERKEKPLDAAKRELLEETGMKARSWKLLKGYDMPGGTKIAWKGYLYAARECKRVSEPILEPGELIEPRLVSFEFALSMPEKIVRADPFLIEYFRKIRKSGRMKAWFKSQLF